MLSFSHILGFFCLPGRPGRIFYHRTQRFKVTSKLQKWHWSSALRERKDMRDCSQGRNSRWAGEKLPVWKQKCWPGGLRQAGVPAVGHLPWEAPAFRKQTFLLLEGAGWPENHWQARAREKHCLSVLSTMWSTPWEEGKLNLVATGPLNCLHHHLSALTQRAGHGHPSRWLCSQMPSRSPGEIPYPVENAWRKIKGEVPCSNFS